MNATTTSHTIRTHVITWALGDHTGSFEVDSYPGDDYATAADEYVAENFGTDAVVTSISRKAGA